MTAPMAAASFDHGTMTAIVGNVCSFMVATDECPIGLILQTAHRPPWHRLPRTPRSRALPCPTCLSELFFAAPVIPLGSTNFTPRYIFSVYSIITGYPD